MALAMRFSSASYASAPFNAALTTPPLPSVFGTSVADGNAVAVAVFSPGAIRPGRGAAHAASLSATPPQTGIVSPLSSAGAPSEPSSTGRGATVRTSKRAKRSTRVYGASLSAGEEETGKRDPDLWYVLEIASDEELQELSDILYGPSLLSPMVKSVAFGDGTDTVPTLPLVTLSSDGPPTRSHDPDKGNSGRGRKGGGGGEGAGGRGGSGGRGGGQGESGGAEGEGTAVNYELQQRDAFLERLEARFFFLSADARETLTGRRPTYREVLEAVRDKLGVSCSPGLATQDLEAEVFLHLCNNYGSEEDEGQPSRRRQRQGSEEGVLSVGSLVKEGRSFLLELLRSNSVRDRGGGAGGRSAGGSKEGTVGVRGQEDGGVRGALRILRSGVRAALDMSKDETLTTLLKGSTAYTASALKNLTVKQLLRSLVREMSVHEAAMLLVGKGGKAAIAQVESRVLLHSARQSLTTAAARYVGLRTVMSVLGPILWGAFLADVVLQSVGTDYARVVRAIYTIAQIRLTRTYGWTRGQSR